MRIYLFLLFAIAISLHGASPRAEESAQVTVARATKLKDNVTSFALYLNFIPEVGGAKHYSLTLLVPPVAILQNDLFGLHAQISEAQALKIIDCLAKDGCLHELQDVSNGQNASCEVTGPSYLLTVVAPSKTARFLLRGELGWGATMLARLDALSNVLDGDAANRMQKLLANLAKERKEWEKVQKDK